MKETTYFTTRYPNGDETFHTKDCEYTTLDALEEALKVAKFLPIGSQVIISDERKTKLEYVFVVERVGEHGVCITEYNGNGEPKIINTEEIPSHFRSVKHVNKA